MKPPSGSFFAGLPLLLLFLAISLTHFETAVATTFQENGGSNKNNNNKNEYNVELVRRNVVVRLDEFLSKPIATNGRMRELLDAGFFPNHLGAQDRDAALKFWYSEAMAYGLTSAMGLEDGMFLGLHANGGGSFVSYREPGDSGYPVPSPEQLEFLPPDTAERVIPNDKKKYWEACVDRANGEVQNCRMASGALYGKMAPTPTLEECPGQEESNSGINENVLRSSSNATILTTNATTINSIEKKYCRKYTIETVAEGATLGHIPWHFYCMSDNGTPTEKAGQKVLDIPDLNSPGVESSDEKLQLDVQRDFLLNKGDCTFDDGTPVQRGNLMGNYAYCGDGTEVCNNTYTGGYWSLTYDPRYRDWYTNIRNTQKPQWSNVFPAVPDFTYIMTYSSPLYKTDVETGKSVFYGVLNGK